MKATLDLREQRLLLFSVFVLSLCGITYELVLGSLATYLLGNPVLQYSVTIGVFLSSMGLGSYLSRFIAGDLLGSFIRIEISLGFVGGISVLLLSALFSFSASFYLLHILFLVVIGAMVGLEIPLLTRLLKRYGSLKDVLSNVLSVDYIGGLAGSLLFPLVLFPFIGRLLTSILIGVANIAVALLVILYVEQGKRRRTDMFLAGMAAGLLVVLALESGTISGMLQKRLYYDDIVFSKRTRYQEIVLTRNDDDFRLYLDGSLQFSSIDEYRYHEMLVHPPLMLFGGTRKKVLVLGGGDGLAVRSVLRHGGVESITLVELDPAMIDLAKHNPSFRRLNEDSLWQETVRVIIGDAYDFLIRNRDRYQIIIADFPDPHDETMAKLYTVEFFGLVKRSLAPGGVFVTQSTSPLQAPEAFWCISETMKRVFREVVPYHVYVPAFGDWGFNMASMEGIDTGGIRDLDDGVRYFSREMFLSSLHFPKDSRSAGIEVNTFNRPVLYRYYLKGWRRSVD